jgi:hypothetical protein
MHITASHIAEWANTKAKEAQTNLPRLIRRLCFEAATTRQLSFPAGDSTYVPGWDGVLAREQGDAWAPSGTSYWEIGCEKVPTTKANDDYQKRFKTTMTEERASATFVFVTPRRWTTKTKWISAQRAKKEWADVRAYDADDLEQWLEQSPTIALQFAEELGLVGEGIESLPRYWQSWSQQCSPAITPESFFLDRTTTRDQLIEKIRGGLTQQNVSPPLAIRADSVEEAAAFVVAALMGVDGLVNQALVVTSTAGWRFVEANRQLKIVIAARTDVATSPALRPGLVVIVPHAAGDTTTQPKGTEVLLERPSIYEFEKALVAIGMEESDAKRYALSTGRSWTVLRRQRATNLAIRSPEWLDAPQSASLSLLCLLGTWSADKEADRQVVARLASRPYEDIERELQQLALLDDAPLLRIGAVWKAKSPLELLSLLGGRITRSELDRFFLIAQEMLVAPDPQLELPDDQRFAAAVYGKVHPYSGLLFKSVCDSLVKLAVRGPEQAGLRALEIEARVGQFVHGLLDAADAQRWLSLASHLPMLAEAAPSHFLTAVEKSLRLPNQPVTRLLSESSTSGISGRCWHAGLLWALETLAWSPTQLARVALVLAQLTRTPIAGNWGNTPGRSLFGLFRSWLPKTAAGISDRIKVLDLLISKEPNTAFGLLDGLTAPGSQTAMDAARPKWRDDDAGAGRSVTYAEMDEMHAAAKERLFQLSASNPSRIATLLQNTRKDEPEEVFKVLALMAPFTLPAVTDEDREILRRALRKTIHWHRNYNDAPATEFEAWLQAVERCYERLAPVDLVRKHCWLFNSHWIELPTREREDPVDARQAAFSEARSSALEEIQKNLGMMGVENLVAACAEPGTVGQTLAEMDCAEGHWPEWFTTKGGNFEQGTHMAWCISGFLHTTKSPRSAELLRNVMTIGDRQAWDVDKRVRFLVLARPERDTWQLASACGPDVETAYWAIAQPAHYLHAESADLLFVLRRLLDAKRPRTALQCAKYALNHVGADLLYSALQQFMAGEEPEGPRLESWHLGEMLESLEKSNAIEKMALIQLEFGLFPALGYGQESRAAALYAGVMAEPALFKDLLCFLYKPEHGERDEPATDASRAAAETAWKILHACRRQPGTQADGSIDPNAFTLFIDTARELCDEADRLTMCEQTLGQILAYAPTDEDGTWPFMPARDVLDRSDLEEMRTGFSIGTRNKRGVTSRSPCDGGGQERDLSAHYRSQAERIQYTHPNLAATLEKIAKSYEHEGRREDLDASLRKEGY